MNPQTSSYTSKPRGLLIAAAIVFLVSLFLIFLLALELQAPGQPQYQLIGLGVFIGLLSLMPSILSMKKHQPGLDPFHPLFYASWFFFIPHFTVAIIFITIGGLKTSAAFQLSNPWESRYEAALFGLLGSISLSVGYLLPLGRSIGRFAPSFETLDLHTSQLKVSTIFFLSIGLLAKSLAFISGMIGYQISTQIPIFGNTLVSLGDLILIGQFIVWYAYFKGERNWQMQVLICICLVFYDLITLGARGALLSSLFIVISAYVYSRAGRLKFSRITMWVVTGGIVLFFGFIFGTQFRLTKIQLMGRSAQMTFNNVMQISDVTLQHIYDSDVLELIQFSWDRIIERLDGITSMAAIMSKYNQNQYKLIEQQLGIDQNILKDLSTSLIPRFFWPDKPLVGISEQIGNIYFGTQFHSPAVTYMVDLYRNFGTTGIVAGMALLGGTLRAVYVWLLEDQKITAMRGGIFMLLGWSVVNYEGLYSTFYPGLLRTIFIAGVIIFIAHLMKPSRNRAG